MTKYDAKSRDRCTKVEGRARADGRQANYPSSCVGSPPGACNPACPRTTTCPTLRRRAPRPDRPRTGRLRGRRRHITSDAAVSRRRRRSCKRTQPGAQRRQPGIGPPSRRAARPPRAAPARPRRPRCHAVAPGCRTGPAGTAGTSPGSPRRAEWLAAGRTGSTRTGRRRRGSRGRLGS